MNPRPLQPMHPVAGWRRIAVLTILTVGCVLVLGRAFQLQVFEREFLREQGDRRQVRTLEIPAHRGAVLDRNGEPLALSAPVERIWVVPAALLESAPHVRAMAQLLGRKHAEFEKFLKARSGKRFVYVSEAMAPSEAKRILALKAPGVFSEPSYARYYPAGEVAGQLVGFCGRDGNGLEGIEKASDRVLGGSAGSRRVIRDRTGRIVEDNLEYRAAKPGRDVQLTIDLRVQYLAYRELKLAVEKNHAKGGMIVVADSATGEILAMASQPGFNPNNPGERASAGVRNRSLADLFEPGSTVKPLLIAQALELGKFQPTSLIDTTPGTLKVGALTVRDVHPQGVIDLTRLLSKSSNVGAAKVGIAMGPEAVWSGYQRFGLGDLVDVGFPGAPSPVLRDFHGWGQIATATASYGYGFSLNSLNLLRAYAALANDGLMPQMRLLASQAAQPPQRTVSANSARAVRKMLQSVVMPGGTATRAGFAGYTVAGKTGTVRKVAQGGGYAGNRHQALFIGMVPAEHPRLVGIVMIDEPSAHGYYGGLVSAPVFSTVLQGAARLLQVAPDDVPLPERDRQMALLEKAVKS